MLKNLILINFYIFFRNCEWLFGVAQGRINLVESSGFDRLAIIHLHRNQEYDTLEDVEQEIYGTIVKLAPAVLKVHLRRKRVNILLLTL